MMTSPDPIVHPPPDSSTVADLLARRSKLQGWLERLDHLHDDAPGRVSERVRADYEQRMAAIVEELSSHVETLRRELEQLRERLRGADERHEAVLDAMEEAQLRYRIGELEEGEWELRRPQLEAEVQEAGTARAAAVEEAARLEELLAQIDTAPVESRSVPNRAPEVEPLAPADRPTSAEAIPQEPPSGEGPDDLAFLEELDRAIAATGPGEEPVTETRPQPGVKCPECGYTNDPAAWYCGVCGVDLS